MILDIMDEAFDGQDDVRKIVKNFRDEFFVDIIDYNKIMKIAEELTQLVLEHTSDFMLISLSQTLTEAIEGQKDYEILKFK